MCVAINPTQQFEQVSFVNGITTYQGGKHVEYITNQVCKKLAEYIEKKKKIKVRLLILKRISSYLFEQLLTTQVLIVKLRNS